MVRPMRCFLLCGSHRRASQSLKVTRYLAAALAQEVPGASALVHSLAGNPLPLWEDADEAERAQAWGPMARDLRAADALVLVTPEWSGMATPGVKNFLLHCTAEEVGHKPGLIVAVSAGRGGSYPVAELRLSGTKNNRLLWIPEHVLVQNVAGSLNLPDGAPDLGREDAAIRDRLRYGLRVLGAYARALTQVRSSGIIDPRAFPNGM